MINCVRLMINALQFYSLITYSTG